ncbi:HupE/UreJ family protein [Actinoplanes oblitus]|uniref:HupE/UreJ family protein n=1 Tax=Actinoplanes oblitus TaxID=3040509 RepID=A0ABY8WUQ5_9ACTN|nr:HupE/UreJ family protein [Actinoplanes oblitus]WIN00140.1 HupE/UreJ family protein [Actinoplanes oblitus]
MTVRTTGNAATTGCYQELQTIFTLTPPAGTDLRSFDLGYNAIVDRVATHVVIVTVGSDIAGESAGASTIGTISRDTVTNTVQPLHVDLGSGGRYHGFLSMITLGMQHIREGTDHQLFLLTLLLPAPLLARNRRWTGAVGARRALRRITSITVSFTLGHSVTLALGAVGVPVPQQLVEALIAVSILVAAAHAMRPLFPGREALIAAAFGLVHGLAFSEALRELHLSGAQLMLSLLGFNLGIEAMQLIIVVLVLPPLILLARANRYRTLRLVAAAATAVAAAGWLAARIGLPNTVANLADRIEILAIPVVLGLWLVALAITIRDRRQQASSTPSPVGLDQPNSDHHWSLLVNRLTGLPLAEIE